MYKKCGGSKIYDDLKNKREYIRDEVMRQINNDTELIDLNGKKLDNELIQKLKKHYNTIIINSIDSNLLKDKKELTKFIVNMIFDDYVIESIYNISTLDKIEIKKYICDYIRYNFIYKERE